MIKILIVLMVLYAAIINVNLVLSMLLALFVSFLIIALFEVNDKEIMENVMRDEGIPEQLMKKYGAVLSMGFVTFLVLTTLFYRLFTF